MVYFGLQHMAWSKAIQYGDGLANNQFWKAELYWYSLLGKVQFQHISRMLHPSLYPHLLLCSGNIESKRQRRWQLLRDCTASLWLSPPPTVVLSTRKAAGIQTSPETSMYYLIWTKPPPWKTTFEIVFYI